MKPGQRAAAMEVAATSEGELPGTAASVLEEPVSPRSLTARDRRVMIAELMEAHGEAVLGFCMRLLSIQALAEEVMQQVFLEAYRDRDRFEGRSSPRTWLRGIAYHRCMDVLRAQDRRLQLIENDEQAMLGHEDPGPGPGELFDRAQRIAALEQCMKRLSPEVRATVLLRYQADASYEAMAVQLGASADALQMRVARALVVLRRCLENKGWTDE